VTTVGEYLLKARRRDQRARFRAWLAQLWRRSDSF
jgi:hypothetical protein